MNPPNIVLIFCDDLGYGDLGCYDSPTNRTPRIDGLADEGILFTDFYASASVCSPSRASLLTGCYAQRVGLGAGERHSVLFPVDSVGLSSDERTLSSLMKDAGYATACVGKWHLGDQPPFMPSRHGFDFYFGFPYSNDMHPRHPMNDRHDFPELALIRSGQMPRTSENGNAHNVVIEEIEPDQSRLEIRYTDIACRFIRESSGGPFFLYFPHMYVHRPLFAPDEFLPSPRPDGFDGYTDTSIEDYSAEVACLDWSTGRILDTLADCGVAENTLVIFTSDNGSNLMNGGSNAPLRGRKGQYYEGGFRMPCVMRWPAVIPPGTVSHELTATLDILPTVEQLTGEDEKRSGEASCDGISLLSVLESPNTTELDRPAFAYYSGNALSAIRSGRFKLHCESGELYDLEADIGETRDVAAAHPNVVTDLKSRAETFRDDLGNGEREGRSVRAPGRVSNPRPVVEWAETGWDGRG